MGILLKVQRAPNAQIFHEIPYNNYRYVVALLKEFQFFNGQHDKIRNDNLFIVCSIFQQIATKTRSWSKTLVSNHNQVSTRRTKWIKKF